jgi:hypothetical protein
VKEVESQAISGESVKEKYFEIKDQSHGHFDVKFGIYPVGNESSVCYCTDKARANFIQEMLEYWMANHTDLEFQELIKKCGEKER